MVFEDFNTFTEVDVGANRINVASATHVDHVARRDETTYLYKDYGLAHFTDFVHYVDFNSDFDISQSIGFVWGLANNLNNYGGLKGNSQTGIGVFTYDGPNIRLFETHGGNNYEDISAALSAATWYYIRIEKSGTALTCGIWTNSGDRDANDVGAGSYVDGLSLTLQADHSFKFCYACNTYFTGHIFVVDNDIENLDLNEIAPIVGYTTPSATIASMMQRFDLAVYKPKIPKFLPRMII